jgi:integrase
LRAARRGGSDVRRRNPPSIVRAARAKGKRERRIPMDARLHEILKRQFKGAKSRLPGRHTNPNLDSKVKARFSKEHVFVNTQNTPLLQRNLYRKFLAGAKRRKSKRRRL